MSGCLLIANQAVWLLAQGRYVHMGNRFRHGSDAGDSTTFIIFVSVLVTILVVALVAARIVAVRNAPGYFSQNGLFRELCRVHGLDWASRRLLMRLAHYQNLEDPARLFIEPARFQSEQLDGPLAEFRSQLQSIAGVIFAPPKAKKTE